MTAEAHKTEFALLGTHRRILELLLHYEFATAEMLGLAYEHARGRGRYQVRNDLVDLHKQGYVLRLRLRKSYPSLYGDPRPEGFGSEPSIYIPTAQAARELIVPVPDEDDEDYRIRRRYTLQTISARKNIQNREHALGVRLTQLVLTLGSNNPQVVDHWCDQELRIEAEIPDVNRKPGIRKAFSFKPDLGVKFQWDTDRSTLCLVEYERSHRNSSRKVDRFLGYASWLSGESLRDVRREFGIQGQPLVLFVTDTSERAVALRRLAVDTFTAAGIKQKNQPIVLFWPATTWYKTIEQPDSRRPSGLAARMVLRDPIEILQSETLLNFDGELRRLFPTTRGDE